MVNMHLKVTHFRLLFAQLLLLLLSVTVWAPLPMCLSYRFMSSICLQITKIIQYAPHIISRSEEITEHQRKIRDCGHLMFDNINIVTETQTHGRSCIAGI